MSPFGPARIKAVKKEPEALFLGLGARSGLCGPIENLVACTSIRLVHWIEDTEGKRAELRYFRNVHGQESTLLCFSKANLGWRSSASWTIAL